MGLITTQLLNEGMKNADSNRESQMSLYTQNHDIQQHYETQTEDGRGRNKPLASASNAVLTDTKINLFSTQIIPPNKSSSAFMRHASSAAHPDPNPHQFNH